MVLVLMVSELVDKWITNSKRYFFNYKNGFYQLPILSNSPETIVQSLTKMPFVKHNKMQSFFETNNPYLYTQIYYHEVENSCWFLHSFAQYRENINYIKEYKPEVQSDYYQLFLEINKSNNKTVNALLNGIYYPNCTWVLSKPKAIKTHCRFKANQNQTITIYFKEAVIKKWLANNPNFQKSELKKFFDSDADIISWPENLQNAKEIALKLTKLFEKKSADNKPMQQDWKRLALQIFSNFTQKFCANNVAENLLKLPLPDRKILNLTEKILMNNLQAKFIGINELAKQVGTSTTKLKENFKLVYGVTIFQFFRKHQLDSAKVLLQNKNKQVKEVAHRFGYLNTSKFITAYKTQFGNTPRSHQAMAS